MKICTLLCASILLACTFATVEAKPKPVAKPAEIAPSTPAIKTDVASVDEDDIIPDVHLSQTFDYKCELNGALTIYTNTEDNDHAAIRWKNHLYRLKRIETTTGADRFENKKVGLVWIGIPAKGMLMDSQHGEQLANECTTADHYQ